MKTEIRFVPLAIERRDGDDDAVTLTSHAPLWDTLSVDLGGFRETFKRGAFTNLDDDILAGFNHDSSFVLGRTSADTLRLEDAKKGLRYEVDLPDTTAARDLVVLIDRGDIKGSSFEFVADDEEWAKSTDGAFDVRTVIKARLFQVGPVTRPAYEDTTIALRSHDQWLVDHADGLAINPEWLAAARRRLDVAEAEQVL